MLRTYLPVFCFFRTCSPPLLAGERLFFLSSSEARRPYFSMNGQVAFVDSNASLTSLTDMLKSRWNRADTSLWTSRVKRRPVKSRKNSLGVESFTIFVRIRERRYLLKLWMIRFTSWRFVVDTAENGSWKEIRFLASNKYSGRNDLLQARGQPDVRGRL